MLLLTLPTNSDLKRITKNFVEDLQLFMITDYATKQIRPVICCVCDSIPTESQWYSYVGLDEFIKLCNHNKLKKTDAPKIYPKALKDQYTSSNERLKEFILSPETYVNSEDEVLVCKNCLCDLRASVNK
jgi:hypothetical protein